MEHTYFDKQIDRSAGSGSYSTKWMALKQRYPEFERQDVIPMWIADMDFLCPPQVVEAVAKRAAHGIYGYTDSSIVKKFLAAAADWSARRYDWEIKGEWGVFTPGVLLAVTAVVQEFTAPGDGIIIQPPVYYPFQDIIRNNGRRPRENMLVQDEGGQYQINFENLEELAEEETTKLMILCNPHNPVGRVWKEWELLEIARICRKNDILLISDEIHADFVRKDFHHIPIASLDQYVLEHSVTCYAPTKIFNLAGLGAAAAFVPNGGIMERLKKRIAMNRLPASNVFGPLAGYVAYTECERYADEVEGYICGNIDLMSEMVSGTHGITMTKAEGTYFAWLNMKELGLGQEQLYEFLYQKAGLATDFGSWFGIGGEGYTRLNLACPRKTVIQAAERLRVAVDSLQKTGLE